MRILVIEDFELHVEVFETFFSKISKAETIFATNITRAKQALERYHFDHVFIDPLLGGHDYSHQIMDKIDQTQPDPDIYIHTANQETSYRLAETVEEAGLNYCCAKLGETLFDSFLWRANKKVQ